MPSEQQRQYLLSQILPWIRRQIHPVIKERGVCTKVKVSHLNSEGEPRADVGYELVPDYTCDEDIPGPNEVSDLADRVLSLAMNDAMGLRKSLQRYQLTAYFDKDPGASTRYPFRCLGGGNDAIDPSGDLSDGALDSEGPDSKGLTAQAMRHAESMTKMVVDGHGKIMQMALQQNEMLARQNSQLIEKHMAVLQIGETMMDNSRQRDIATKKSEVQLDGFKEIVDKLKLFAPHLINNIFGKNIASSPTSPEEQSMLILAETLTPAQIDGLREKLNPEQFILFSKVVEGLIEKTSAKGNAAVAGAPEGEARKSIAAPASHKPIGRITGG